MSFFGGGVWGGVFLEKILWCDDQKKNLAQNVYKENSAYFEGKKFNITIFR